MVRLKPCEIKAALKDFDYLIDSDFEWRELNRRLALDMAQIIKNKEVTAICEPSDDGLIVHCLHGENLAQNFPKLLAFYQPHKVLFQTKKRGLVKMLKDYQPAIINDYGDLIEVELVRIIW